MVLCNTSLRKTPQRHRKSRMRISEMRTTPTNKNKKLKKVVDKPKTLWYDIRVAPVERQQRNNLRTLITEQ